MNYGKYKSAGKELIQRRKINFILLLLIVVFAMIFLKLVNVQVIDSEKYKIAARKQYENKIILTPFRGLIYDRNMNVLVSNSYEYSFAADPNMIEKPEEVAKIFSNTFGKSTEEYMSKLTSQNTSFVYLERKVDVNNTKGLDTLNISGVIVLKEPKRVYNYGSLASQIIGFTNADNNGQTGIELSMEQELEGKEGFVIMQRDGRGNNRPAVEFPRKDPENGNSIVLTIDVNIQKFAEEELRDGVINFNADGGKVLVLSVKTGEILAMASYPSYNPNSISVSDTLGMKNTVISDVFEPGSTFKLITAAAAIEEKFEDKNSVIETDNLSEVKGLKITDVHSAKSMTFEQIVEQSSNVGFSKVSLKLGPERFYKYARDFGFGIYSGVELPGENKGYLKRPIDFSSFSLPYMSIGYEILVNSMQIANAYAAIANNGMMMKPFIVRKEISNDARIIYESKPTQIRQVVSEKTAKSLTDLFLNVVESGTGKDAGIEGIKIAGKTGTAQRLVDGKYSSNSHNASFVGYFPADNPGVILLVVLNNPKSGDYYGGKVAAPVFKKIAERIIGFKGTSDIHQSSILNVRNFETQNETNIVNEISDKSILIPNLLNLKYEDALDILKENNITYQIISNEESSIKGNNTIKVIDSQIPMPNERVADKNNLTIKLTVKENIVQNDRLIIVPDVTNLSLRKAINVLLADGFDFFISGSGEIAGQTPLPGTKQLPGSKVILYCKNHQ